MNIMKAEKNYESPEVEIIEVAVEKVLQLLTEMQVVKLLIYHGVTIFNEQSLIKDNLTHYL